MAKLTRLLPEQPAVEFLAGRPHRKVSPQRTHAMVQFAVARALYAAACGRGDVLTEWHIRPGRLLDEHTEFVPDVAFVSHERLRELAPDEREIPGFSPDVVVEVWSPSNDRAYLEAKIATYLATGALLVLDVDPYARTVAAHDGNAVDRFCETDTFEHERVPWLRFPVADLFRDL